MQTASMASLAILHVTSLMQLIEEKHNTFPTLMQLLLVTLPAWTLS